MLKALRFDQYDFKGDGLFDPALTYGVPVWKTARPWIKVEFNNLLKNSKLIAWDATVTSDPNSPKNANGLPTGYIPGARFGQATVDNQFPQPIPGQNGEGCSAWRWGCGSDLIHTLGGRASAGPSRAVQ